MWRVVSGVCAHGECACVGCVYGDSCPQPTLPTPNRYLQSMIAPIHVEFPRLWLPSREQAHHQPPLSLPSLSVLLCCALCGRWNEDGLAGVCNRFQNVVQSCALWNGRDPILKERLFGLSGPEGNHGEDVKE